MPKRNRETIPADGPVRRVGIPLHVYSDMTRINVQVKPRASRLSVVEVDASHYLVAVSEPPTEGKANDAVVRALAAHLGIAQSRLSLVRGAASRTKVFEVT